MIVLQVITISKSIMFWFFSIVLKNVKIIPILSPYCPAIVTLRTFDPVLCSLLPFLCFISSSHAGQSTHLLDCIVLSLPPSLLLSVSGCVHVKLHSLTSESSVRSPTGCLSVLQTPACVTAPSYLARQQEFSIDLVSL